MRSKVKPKKKGFPHFSDNYTCQLSRSLSPSQVSVVVGQLSLIFTEQYERRYQVVSIIPHEGYDANLGLNNLAVIEVGVEI
jgi:hypothetical protein